MNEIDIKHINTLTAPQLSELLHTLLKTEATKNRLEGWDASVPFNITTGDGGSDGRIVWKGEPAKTKWLKNKFTIFQNKATTLTPKECVGELLITTKKGESPKLKTQIEKVVSANGAYILFINKQIVDNGIDERIKKFREAIKLAGKPNFETIDIYIYDSHKIKDWVNENISAITLVQGFSGIHRPNGFRVWVNWEIHSNAKDNEYKVDKKISQNINLIQESIQSENVIRVTGHSGLGKTRLVLEAFRDSPLQKSLVYLNLEGNSDISEIKNYIISSQDSQSGIIVIDNCDIKNHNILSDLVKNNGELKIITIGLEDNNSIEDLKIKIERNDQRNIVREIIINKLGPNYPLSDIDYINTVSEGYPWMAIRFCDEVLKQGMLELSKIPIDKFIPKLIFGTRDEIERGIIRACSVFSAFGFLDDSFKNVINNEYKDSLKAQMTFIRTKIYDGDITEFKFKETCTKFLKDDIIERRGTYYIVKPTILAINLAADWLMNTDSDKIIEIIQELKEVKLEEKFVERLKDLDQIDKARDIVKELWGPLSPFGTAEVLNTSWGSLLFRHVVEVNPIATSLALKSSFGTMQKEDIFNINEGRRNLVWALEKLCFRRETFNISAKILYSFAVSENEDWGNNSTNQFIQLFQLFLSGTEATLKERLEILKWGLEKNDEDYTQLALKAIERGLLNDRYVRMGGAESQGSSAPLKDNRPTGIEILDFWRELVLILTDVSISDNTHSKLALEILSNSIRGLIRENQSEIILNSIQTIISKRGNIWLDALNNLKMTLGLETKLPENIIKQIESLITILTPTDIKNQLLLKVSNPEWTNYEKDDENHFIDWPRLNAETFAQELVQNKIKWTGCLVDLLQGEQRQAFNFGAKFASLSEENNSIIDLSIQVLKQIKKENQNPELIAGLISGTKSRGLFEKTIDLFIKDEDLRHHSFYLTRVMNPTFEDINKLFVLVDEYNMPVNEFSNFQYGRSLENLNLEAIIKICKKLETYNYEGQWTALSLIYRFCFQNEENLNNSSNYIKDILSKNNLLIHTQNIRKIEIYHWSDFVISILNDNKNVEFSVIISNQIIEFCSNKHFIHSFDSDINRVIIKIFDQYFDSIWEYFGKALIGDYWTYHHLKDLIGTRNGNFDNLEGILFQNEENQNTILTWCRVNPTAPERIINMTPIKKNVEGEIKWNPFTKALIDEFGNSEKFLSSLGANMGTFGTIGSRVSYYKDQKFLLEELLNHKFEKVKDWARLMLEYTEKQIKLEKLDDEHYLN